MPFDTLQKNLTHLQSQEEIASEDIVDSMSRLLSDAEQYNLGRGHSDFRARNIEQYSLALQDLLLMLNRIFELHKKEFDRLGDDDLTEAYDESQKVIADIENKKTLLAELSEKKKAKEGLIAEAGRLNIQITALEHELSELGDVSIDDLKKKEAILQQKTSDLAELKQRLDSMTAEIITLESGLSEAIVEQTNLERRKGEIVEAEKKTADTIAAYKSWIKSHEKTDSENNTIFMEAINTFTAISNAWNSIKHREGISEVINNTVDCAPLDAEIKSYSDLEAWFNRTSKQITTLADAYREMYSRVIDVIKQGDQL